MRNLHPLNILLAVGAARVTGRPQPVAPGPSQHIVNGWDASPSRFPYIALLHNELGDDVCGGSLIAPDLVLSAAHCADASVGIASLTIGQYELNEGQGKASNSTAEVFVVDQSNIVQHPLYSNSMASLFNENFMDFSIIKIFGLAESSPVKLNKKDHIPFLEGTKCAVIGLGKSGLHAVSRSESSLKLQETEVRYVSNKRCEASEGWVETESYYESYRGLINEDNICAKGFDGADACHGDSGGPLIMKGTAPSSDLQVGVVSWGAGCGDADFPGVYARISNQWKWIQEQVCEKSAAPPSSFACPHKRTTAKAQLNYITLFITFGNFADNQGYILTSEDGKQLFSNNPIGTFTEVSPSTTLHTTVELEVGSRYKFVFFDSGASEERIAMNSATSYQMYRGDYTMNDLLLHGTIGDRGVQFSIEHDFVLEGDVGNDNHRPKSDTKTTPGGPVELDEPSANDTFPEVDESNASRIDVLINMLFMASIWTVAFMTLV